VASQRDIKARIDSVRNTRKITRAMELVASAKLRQAQVRIEKMRPYASSMRRFMQQAAKRSSGLAKLPLLEERSDVSTAAVVVITGDRGLAGAFNVNVLRRGFEEASRMRKEGADEVVYVAVGKKGAGTLVFRGDPVDRRFEGFSTEPTFADAQLIGEHVMNRFTNNEFDRVLIVYNAFQSMLVQRVTTEQLLPVERKSFLEEEEDEGAGEPERGSAEWLHARALAEFEPSAEALLEQLLPRFVNTTVYKALVESAAAEHAARRNAMRNATDNAGALITDLTLEMNRARQAAITQEILEVVSGANALE